MISPSFRREILDQISRLDPEQQRSVLDFARALEVTSPSGILSAQGVQGIRGIQGKQLLSFVGAIQTDDLQIMAQAIENDCEKVNSDEW